ncbi:MAG: NYN domain-containing protein [Lachnospiraceae bacterium]|jgi:uncharacterized LabA/DUF88 family protein|nr:NYN domain-containing protein [Lachnospiraceae bacterium]
MEDSKIALLIDADNVSAKYIQGILSELSKYGKITIRRMYGDWSQDRLHGWLNCFTAYSLAPVMQPNNTPGKNASDISLIIDAMDILYRGEADGFCIVSSDGDFNKLAQRLREAGKTVIGMGEKKTPESFRASCERFIFLDVIDSSDEIADSTSKSKSSRRKQPARASKKATPQLSENQTRPQGSPYAASAVAAPVEESEPAPEESDDTSAEEQTDFTDQGTIEKAIVKMITDNSAEGKETGLGEIGQRLQKIFPDFDIRNYHYTKLSEYVKDFPSLSVATRDNATWVSLKSSSDSEIEKQIRRIFERHGTKDLNIDVLRRELTDMNPNLEASIRKSGVTRFNVYLNREIHSVEVNGDVVTLLS